MPKARIIRRPSGPAWLVAAIIASAVVAAPASATLLFTFSDAGAGTTLVTASGSTDLTGTTAATSPHFVFVGWDDFSGAGDGSTSLVADSDFFSFNFPSVGGVFSSYNAVLGTTPLSVGGVSLITGGALGLDGTGATNPFFVLRFASALPQTGIVAAGGSAVLSFAFANLPYAAGQSIDLQGNGDVVFQFVPEPGTLVLLLLAFGLLALSRRTARAHSA